MAAKNTCPKSWVPRLGADVIARRGSDGLLNMIRLGEESRGGDLIYVLDHVAAEFVSLIDGRRSFGVIQTQLIRKYRLPLKFYTAEVRVLIRQLRHEGLLAN